MILDLRVNPLLREEEESQVGVWASWKQMDVSSLASFPGGFHVVRILPRDTG